MKYIASWSGGKDSTASIILAHEHNEPLDLIIFSEVMFDNNISGELPEHMEFIKNKAIPTFQEWGYTTKILHAKQTYLDLFNRYPTKGKRVGMGLKMGFPMAKKCAVNRDCKIKPIRDFLKQIDEPITQYIGIAIDEPVRLERIADHLDKISLLEKYNYTEEMAYKLCKKYDLLSPVYKYTSRGGCWFCPNAREKELRHTRKNYRYLWDALLELEEQDHLIADKWNMLTKTKLHDWENHFDIEDKQIKISNLS